MNGYESILTCGALAAALLSVAKILQLLHQRWKRGQALEKRVLTMQLTLLRLAVINRDLPLSERIAAGDAYIKLGGNGAVKQLYAHLLALANQPPSDSSR